MKNGRDVHSYIVGTEREKKKKERKTKHRAGRQKKDAAFRRKRRAGNIRANKQFILGGGLMSLLPDPILEGVGDSLLTAADRCAYTVSVPRMYNIVGREGVKTLRSEAWDEAWEARRQQQAARAAEEKKKNAQKWEDAKGEFDSVGGTPFNGVKAIAQRKGVSAARLRRYADRTAKRHHGYDTDSLALVWDSGSDDSGDGDSDATK